MKNIPCIRFASSLFFVVVRSNALSLDLDTTEPEGNPEGRGRNPYFHTHTHTHTQKLFRQFSLSPQFSSNTPSPLSLCVLVVVGGVVVIALVPFAASLAFARPRSRRR